MTKHASRRRLLAGLVLVGLAPVKALAAGSHGNPGADWLDEMGSSSSSSSSSSSGTLPDCVVSAEMIAPNVTVSSRVESGNLIRGFLFNISPPVSTLKLTGTRQNMASSQIDLELTCEFSSAAAAGFEIKKIGLYIPGIKPPTGDDFIALGANTLKIGTVSAKKPVGDDGMFGTQLDYDAVQMPAADFQALANAVMNGGALSFQSADKTDPSRTVAFNLTLTKPASLYALAKPKIDKLRSDAAAGLCKIQSASSDDYDAKFCTTATIDVIGLRRNCWELKSLHQFREWMRRDPDHAIEANDYALQAPGVVRAIGRRRDYARVWLGAYFTGVLPAAAAARFGANRLARLIYRRMCFRLLRLSLQPL